MDFIANLRSVSIIVFIKIKMLTSSSKIFVLKTGKNSLTWLKAFKSLISLVLSSGFSSRIISFATKTIPDEKSIEINRPYKKHLNLWILICLFFLEKDWNSLQSFFYLKYLHIQHIISIFVSYFKTYK